MEGLGAQCSLFRDLHPSRREDSRPGVGTGTLSAPSLQFYPCPTLIYESRSPLRLWDPYLLPSGGKD